MSSFGRRAFVSSACVTLLFGGNASAQSFAARRLGTTTDGKEVKVLREIGPAAGYADRMQAIAVARMAASEAVVVRTRDGRWHALATSANAYGGLRNVADNGDVREIVPLASYAGIAASRKTTIDEAFAAYVLGLEKKDVRLAAREGDRDASFITITARLPRDLGGTHGPEKTATEGFQPDTRTAIELNRTLFVSGDPRAANAAFFHELTHRADYELAQKWVKAYRDTGADYTNAKAFVTWLLQRPKVLTPDDAQTVADIAARAHGSTEARAYVGTFIAAMHAGAPDIAQAQLVAYARGVAAGSIPGPTLHPDRDLVVAALRADLEECHRALDATAKKHFDGAMAAAKSAAKGVWISQPARSAAKRS